MARVAHAAVSYGTQAARAAQLLGPLCESFTILQAFLPAAFLTRAQLSGCDTHIAHPVQWWGVVTPSAGATTRVAALRARAQPLCVSVLHPVAAAHRTSRARVSDLAFVKPRWMPGTARPRQEPWHWEGACCDVERQPLLDCCGWSVLLLAQSTGKKCAGAPGYAWCDMF